MYCLFVYIGVSSQYQINYRCLLPRRHSFQEQLEVYTHCNRVLFTCQLLVNSWEFLIKQWWSLVVCYGSYIHAEQKIHEKLKRNVKFCLFTTEWDLYTCTTYKRIQTCDIVAHVQRQQSIVYLSASKTVENSLLNNDDHELFVMVAIYIHAEQKYMINIRNRNKCQILLNIHTQLIREHKLVTYIVAPW